MVYGCSSSYIRMLDFGVETEKKGSEEQVEVLLQVLQGMLASYGKL